MCDMKCWVVIFALLLVNVAARSVREIKDDRSSEEVVCEYKGLQYKEGEDLPTEGMCLVCRCHKGFVEPNVLSCAVIDCPWGYYRRNYGDCDSVYDENECCPVAWNCDTEQPSDIFSSAVLLAQEDQCKCDWRYYKHYETKGCTPVYRDGCDCPVKFDCPVVETTEEPSVCKNKGKTYEDGEAIETTNPCEICNCRLNYLSDGTAISCIPNECPSMFNPPKLDPGCYEVYEADKCCPVSTNCISPDDQQNVTVSTCEFEGKTYHLGQKIYSEEDPCLICLCTENWTGSTGPGCHQHDCFLERKLNDIQRGCIPIYHEKTCCPIEFYCGSDETANETVEFREAEADSNNTCVFQNKRFERGEILDIKHPTNCVTCTCETPPDFTCVHRSCPRPPNDDYENCRSTYQEGQCCATYDCARAPPAPLECEPVTCNANCTEVMTPGGCSMCLCGPLLCSPPKCDPGCEVETTVSSIGCPGCKCPDDFPVPQIQCSPVKCSPECREAIGPEGCPTCVCGPLCSPPKCEPGCRVETDLSEGICPGCVCEPASDTEDDADVQCAPVKCDPQCREATGRYGCSVCVCDPLCSPPKCDPGCEVEKDVSTGKCPGCVCGNLPVPQVQCAPVQCDPGCRESIGSEGCPACFCGPLCSPPKCDPGCEIETNVQPGECPGCVCGSLPVSRSEVVQSEPNTASEEAFTDALEECRVKRCPNGEVCMMKATACENSDSCPPQPTCEKYEVDCNLPACALGCVLEGRGENNCPICRCSNGIIDDRQCPPPVCKGRDCKFLLGPDGCAFCNCRQPSCETDRCPQDCVVDLAAREAEGICLCKCTSGWRSKKVSTEENQCPPSVCKGRDCKHLVGPDGCSFCHCRQPSCETERCPQDCVVDIAVREAEGICLCKCTSGWRSKSDEE